MKEQVLKGFSGGNVFLTGFMGTGKSAVARELNRRYGMKSLEMDACIARRQGMSITGIFKKYGEQYFRDLESALLEELKSNMGMVVSCGGGVVLRSENVKCMKESGTIVLLTASAETIYDRVKGNRDRPILNENMSVEYIRELMEKRREWYELAADITIETDRKTILQVCEEIAEGVNEN